MIEDELEGLEDIESYVTFYIKKGEIYVDINLTDYSDETLNNFAKVIAGLSSLKLQLETIEMIKEGFLGDGKKSELNKFLLKVASICALNTQSIEEHFEEKKAEKKAGKKGGKKEGEPCIKPSDML
jgi:hypothetical protein